ncbi:MAG: hypothetical protein ABI166_06850 [Mucilaginibacter sp.]
MKTLAQYIIILSIAIALTACSKNGDSPHKIVVTPLINEMAITSRYTREVYNFSYDDQKRLTGISTPNLIDPITYNAGGLQMINTSESTKKKVIDFALEEGRIKTVVYNLFISQVNQNMPIKSTFNYDTKGRLIKIKQLIALTPPPSTYRTLIYTFTWDDNDNLVTSRLDDPDFSSSIYTSTYSGFSAENTNTSLTGKNFGFDYLGPVGWFNDFHPDAQVTTGVILPFISPGKILPTVWKVINTTYNIVYHKNTQGYIDRIEETNAADANEYYYTDIVYQ